MSRSISSARASSQCASVGTGAEAVAEADTEAEAEVEAEAEAEFETEDEAEDEAVDEEEAAAGAGADKDTAAAEANGGTAAARTGVVPTAPVVAADALCTLPRPPRAFAVGVPAAVADDDESALATLSIHALSAACVGDVDDSTAGSSAPSSAYTRSNAARCVLWKARRK
jgi:hypothetical protein